MPRLPISEQALRLALTRPSTFAQSNYVCRTCIRQYHPTPALRAELPFWKRLQHSIFGSPEQKVATEKREEAHQKHIQELADKGGTEMQPYTDNEGREWQIAAVVDPSINKQYVQAQRWDGLQWIGTKEWVALNNDGKEAYVGFNPRRKLDLTNAQWNRLLHHVAVEVLTLAQADRDVNAVHLERPVKVEEWMRSARVQIKETNGVIELQFPTEDTQELIVNAVPQSLAEEIMIAAKQAEEAAEAATEAEKAAAAAEDAARADAEAKGIPYEPAEAPLEKVEEEAEAEAEAEAEEAVEAPFVDRRSAKEISAAEKLYMRQIRDAVRKSATPVNNEWLRTSLAAPAVKLAILKRVTQLTGHRLPDPVMTSATSMSDLYLAFKIKPQPKKLADERRMHKLNLDVPNITVHPVRQTPIHKDREVGRWKVIEQELINKGLPITGSRYQHAKTTSPIF